MTLNPESCKCTNILETYQKWSSVLFLLLLPNAAHKKLWKNLRNKLTQNGPPLLHCCCCQIRLVWSHSNLTMHFREQRSYRRWSATPFVLPDGTDLLWHTFIMSSGGRSPQQSAVRPCEHQLLLIVTASLCRHNTYTLLTTQVKRRVLVVKHCSYPHMQTVTPQAHKPMTKNIRAKPLLPWSASRQFAEKEAFKYNCADWQTGLHNAKWCRRCSLYTRRVNSVVSVISGHVVYTNCVRPCPWSNICLLARLNAVDMQETDAWQKAHAHATCCM